MYGDIQRGDTITVKNSKNSYINGKEGVVTLVFEGKSLKEKYYHIEIEGKTYQVFHSEI